MRECALGKEGSDFARSKRQEKVLSAFRDKLFSAETLLNPVKIANIVGTLADSIKTDIKESEYDDFVKLAKKMEQAKLTSIALDTGDGAAERYGLLENPPTSEEFHKAWVLIPRVGNGDYSEITEYIICQIEGKNCEIGQQGILTPTPTLNPDQKNN